MKDTEIIKKDTFSDSLRSLPDRPAIEILAYGASKENALFLAQGEGSNPSPEFVIDGFKGALDEGKTFYTPSRGIFALRQEIQEYYKRIYHADIPVDRIMITPSGSTANKVAQESILNAGDEIIILSPVWQNLMGAAYLQNATIKELPLDQDHDGQWYLDNQKLFDAVSPKTKAILINSPNNPTGWVMPDSQIQDIVSFCRDKSLWMISDEVYGRLSYNHDHAPSFLKHTTGNDKLLVINSFSKSYAMTGARLGWLVIPDNTQNLYDELLRYANLCTSSMAQYAGISALRNGEDFIKKEKEKFMKNAEIVTAFFDRYPNVKFDKPESSFYAFFKLPNDMDCCEFARWLIDEEALVLNPGQNFGCYARGYLRMCFAVNEDVLNDALARLSRVLDKLK